MEKEKPVVLGKTSYYYKIAVPILMAAVIGVLVLIGVAFIEAIPILAITMFCICALPGLILLLYVLLPLGAVLYDEKRDVLILRGGRKFIFSAFKRQEIPMGDIKKEPKEKTVAWGESPNAKYVFLGWLFLDTQGHLEGLHITTVHGEIRLFTVGKSESAAKNIQARYEKFRYKLNFQTPTGTAE
ncbi:MAG: hypothetical protein FWD58_00810 [Firmicutes bacterium]|nr:hypothetical protein [Bacillota bacterium]